MGIDTTLNAITVQTKVRPSIAEDLKTQAHAMGVSQYAWIRMAIHHFLIHNKTTGVTGDGRNVQS
jgi:hypothetical protein